jgi:Spy/CpxP family protein refolding chaperone
MKTLASLCTISVLFISSALAQTSEAAAKPLTDADIQLIRSDVQADKNHIITDTMAFSDQESAAFWPIYRDYARDQQAIGDKRWKLIKDYAEHYDSLDDAKAKDLAKQMFDIDNKTIKLRQDYWPKFEKALGAKRAAKFYQVDNRLSLIINLKLSSDIPLIE